MNKYFLIKFFIILVLIMLFPIIAFASQSTNFTSNPNLIDSGGDKSSSASYVNLCTIGISSFFNTASPNYSSSNGFLIALVGQVDVTAPTISNVKFDGQEVAKNDFIKSNATLTASVLDAGGISPNTSSVIVDGTATYFKNFVSPSSYNSTTGSLTFKLNLNNGMHTIGISAKDLTNNASSCSQTVKVETGEPKATATFIFPNPFDPNHGKARIAYQLNQDANVTLYIFNEINQQVWQRNFTAGSNGGRSGYNEIEWGGENDFGGMAHNGAYFLRIVSGGKVIGKIKIAVLKRP